MLGKKMASIQVGQFILKARTLAGLSQTALATQVGVTGACVCRWESGSYLPSQHQIPKLAQAMGVPEADFQAMFESRLQLSPDQDPTTMLARGLAEFLVNAPERINLERARQLLKLVGAVSETISSRRAFEQLPIESRGHWRESKRNPVKANF